MGDTRWVDYIVAVRRGGNPSLTWSQFLAALEHGRPQQVSHPERPHPREPYPREQQRQPHAGQAATSNPSKQDKRDRKASTHRQNVTNYHESQRSNEEAEVTRRIFRSRQQQEEADAQDMAARWKNNRGEAAASVPHLPQELYPWVRVIIVKLRVNPLQCAE